MRAAGKLKVEELGDGIIPGVNTRSFVNSVEESGDCVISCHPLYSTPLNKDSGRRFATQSEKKWASRSSYLDSISLRKHTSGSLSKVLVCKSLSATDFSVHLPC